MHLLLLSGLRVTLGEFRRLLPGKSHSRDKGVLTRPKQSTIQINDVGVSNKRATGKKPFSAKTRDHIVNCARVNRLFRSSHFSPVIDRLAVPAFERKRRQTVSLRTASLGKRRRGRQRTISSNSCKRVRNPYSVLTYASPLSRRRGEHSRRTPASALHAHIYSEKVDLPRSAALCFSEMSEKRKREL